MTMIVYAHLNDCILIAADKRALFCDIETGNMRLSHDSERKIDRWHRGAVAGTGETVLLDRIAEYFMNVPNDAQQLKQMDVIEEEIAQRVREGVPFDHLNPTIIFSLFNGQTTQLYSVSAKSSVNEHKHLIIELEQQELKPWTVMVNCYHLPPDMGIFQSFQRQLKSLSDFTDELHFLDHYIKQLKIIFGAHAQIDPSITTCFDLYLQSCSTGAELFLNIDSEFQPSTISSNFNYWDEHKKRDPSGNNIDYKQN